MIGHVQIAQAPDRSEPVGKQIDFPTFFDRMDADGYAGWVGAAYRPKTETTLGLDWLTS
jgi:hydroxypyruvate isomerase